jgi:hypothetical protein
MPVGFAITGSSALGRQYRTQWACEPTGIFCRGFGGAIMNLSKTMFRLVYIKWILRDGHQNEYRDF